MGTAAAAAAATVADSVAALSISEPLWISPLPLPFCSSSICDLPPLLFPHLHLQLVWFSLSHTAHFFASFKQEERVS